MIYEKFDFYYKVKPPIFTFLATTQQNLNFKYTTKTTKTVKS